MAENQTSVLEEDKTLEPTATTIEQPESLDIIAPVEPTITDRAEPTVATAKTPIIDRAPVVEAAKPVVNL